MSELVGEGTEGRGSGWSCRLRALLRSPLVHKFLRDEAGGPNQRLEMEGSVMAATCGAFEGFLRREGGGSGAVLVAPLAEPPAKRRRVASEEGSSGGGGASAVQGRGGECSDSDDDLIIVGVSTEADRRDAARSHAVDLSDTPQKAAAAENRPAAAFRPAAAGEAPVAVTEELLGEMIQQIAGSK